MGVTNRHLLLLEVNLNKQKSKHYDDSRRNYRCPSRRGGIDRRDRSPNPRRWQKATTTKEGQESQERQKEGQESPKSPKGPKIQEIQKGPKSPKIPKGCQEIQESPKRTKGSQKIQKGPKDQTTICQENRQESPKGSTRPKSR